MANLSFSNKSFQRAIKSIRNVMPILAISLLALVYIVAAIAEGRFLAHLAVDFAMGAWLWYAISAVIQATRALLVYFPMLNPSRPSFGYQGETIAVIMGLIAIGSVWGSVDAIGLPQPVAISLSILMAAGIGVEVFLLREIKFSTEQELFANKEYWEELANFTRSKRELQLFMDNIQDYEPDLDQLMAANSPSPTPLPEPEKPAPQSTRSFSNKLLNVIGNAYKLTDDQMNKIREQMDQKADEEHLILLIDMFSHKNKEAEKQSEIPLSVGLNGNGKP